MLCLNGHGNVELSKNESHMYQKNYRLCIIITTCANVVDFLLITMYYYCEH
nr:MAG TPA: hypothetical protein [Caudoviricetes sp.]